MDWCTCTTCCVLYRVWCWQLQV